MTIRFVTISREYGSGGRDFGQVLAASLRWEFVDSRLVDEVAQRMQCPEDVVQRWDERGEGIILRLLRALQSAHPESVAPGPMSPALLAGDPPPERVMAMVKQTMLEEARRGDAVIVGRGGAWILADEPGAFHVRLVADRADRILRIATRFSLGQEQATKQVDQTDRDRSNYLKHNFGTDWRDPRHFHLVFNTSRIGPVRAAGIVEELVREGRS